MISRRQIFGASAGLAASSLLPAAAQAAEEQVAASPVAQLAASISDKLFDGDGLAVPIPAQPVASDFARTLDRTLVLGGGGEYYVAWYCGFFHGLKEQGVDPTIAEMVVGTSAGAYMGSSLLSGRFWQLLSQFDFFGHFPGLFAKLAPVTAPNASQKRAQEINFAVKDGNPETIRAIGHAALAADNRLNGDGVERLAWLLTGDSRTSWPTPKMFTTSNDCYTGERLVVRQDVARRNAIPLAHAAGASSSLPGVIGPTQLGQRFCMDGGISKSWAHTDLVAGSKRALVITLTNGYEGSLLSGIPHNIHNEISALEATGTKAMLIIAGTPPGVNLLDPKQIEPALKTGYERAKVEAPKIRAFWA
ncbi:patatin-like phospholipase family protein [Aquabacter cavernae]|uniref:patatin-like phospholipase family protein n=1 Tax=Aquabacter cavernae TaxID=2496029 RepID=UPI000F8D949D|nr:patatin-like phospholipase family protein [Aquabacter cavernae]